LKKEVSKSQQKRRKKKIGRHFSAFKEGKACAFEPIKNCHVAVLCFKKKKSKKTGLKEQERENSYQI